MLSIDRLKEVRWKRLILGEWDWKRPVKLVGFVYVAVLIIAIFFADRFIFPYRQSSYGKSLVGLSFIETDTGRRIALREWKVKGGEIGLIIYFHGNVHMRYTQQCMWTLVLP